MTTLDRAFIKAFNEVHKPGGSHPHGMSRMADAAQSLGPSAAAAMHRPTPTSEPGLAAAHRAAAAPMPLSSFAAPPKLDDTFRPMLEVDRLAWPAACDELMAQARANCEQFAERLARGIAADNKCIAITSPERGAGRTTIALTAARLLAARGLRPVVVDADFENPRLAASCNISAQIGWGEVIEGDLPFGEALVGSIEDSVALVPWRGAGGRLAARNAALRASTGFRLLREHYDLVIVDLMPLAGPTAEGEMASLLAVTGPCQIFIVSDVRSRGGQQLASACTRLRRMSLVAAGVIENFAPPGGDLPRHAIVN